MGEKWRRVDDEDDDDEVHLNIQEGGVAAAALAACGGAAFQSPPPETASGAPLGSPTTMGCEEEGEKRWFPPPLLLHYRFPDSGGGRIPRPVVGIPPAGSTLEGGEEGGGVEGSLPPWPQQRGSTNSPL
ncbi:hypothetical protein Sjap_012784 [Stephania japonica]|uniref:Uncharacterized protein n=1 Tax=Stephania japonica TaxID=461633 RepID=A0AAP0IYM8_9MAGN